MDLLHAVTWALIAASVLLVYRIIKGPTFYDRILGVNSIGTNVVVLLVLFGYLYKRPDFADLALVYAIINFITTLAVLKLKEKRSLA